MGWGSPSGWSAQREIVCAPATIRRHPGSHNNKNDKKIAKRWCRLLTLPATTPALPSLGRMTHCIACPPPPSPPCVPGRTRACARHPTS
eukprot:1183765-Prorocentrum_minimum.AAC.5